MAPDEQPPEDVRVDVNPDDIIEALAYVETVLVEYLECDGDTQSAPFYVMALGRLTEYAYGNPQRVAAVAHVTAEVVTGAVLGAVAAMHELAPEDARRVALAGLRATIEAVRTQER